VAQGVAQQVLEHLTDPAWIDLHHGRFLRQILPKGEPFRSRLRLDGSNRPVDHLGEIGNAPVQLELPRLRHG